MFCHDRLLGREFKIVKNRLTAVKLNITYKNNKLKKTYKYLRIFTQRKRYKIDAKLVPPYGCHKAHLSGTSVACLSELTAHLAKPKRHKRVVSDQNCSYIHYFTLVMK